MNIQETGIIMDILETAYPRFYAGKTDRERQRTVSLWAEMFAHDDVAFVAAAVKSVIEGDERGFPPSIGQVKSKLRLILRPAELTEAEAWAMVSKAIRNGIYGSKEEFAKLPPVLQKLVGGPETLREWAVMDTEAVHTVLSSNFQRSYKVMAARERELSKLPPDVRRLVSEIHPGTQRKEMPAARRQCEKSRD